jgi:aldose 1-epimerase
MKFAPPHTVPRPASKWHQWSTSGHMTPVLIGLLCLGMVVGAYEHTRGNLHHLRETVSAPPDQPIPVGPGGEAPVILTRNATPNHAGPEFLSATLLPGRGFNLWQLTAFLPGHGEVPLLVSPPVAGAEDVLTGTGADANGTASTNYGAAFLAPWAGQMSGFPAPANGVLQGQWQSQRLSFPAIAQGSLLSTEGLLLNRGANNVQYLHLVDGQAARATFHPGSFSGGWPGDTDLNIFVELSGPTLDITMTVQNNGTVPEPFGMGWHPHFAIPSGQRAQATLVLPSNTRTTPRDRRTGLYPGTIESTQNTPFDFIHAGGTKLGATSLDDTYLDLHSSVMADGPIAELRDPAENYGLRIIPLTTNIKTLRVIAPADKNWISIGPNMNVPDPLGHEWDNLDSNGMVILQPGDSIQWKVRLEIFAINRAPATTVGQ